MIYEALVPNNPSFNNPKVEGVIDTIYAKVLSAICGRCDLWTYCWRQHWDFAHNVINIWLFGFLVFFYWQTPAAKKKTELTTFHIDRKHFVLLPRMWLLIYLKALYKSRFCNANSEAMKYPFRKKLGLLTKELPEEVTSLRGLICDC